MVRDQQLLGDKESRKTERKEVLQSAQGNMRNGYFPFLGSRFHRYFTL